MSTETIKELRQEVAALTARLAAAEAVVEAAGELEFLDEPCSHLPLEMIDGVMEACDVCALRHALATYRKTTGSQQEATDTLDEFLTRERDEARGKLADLRDAFEQRLCPHESRSGVDQSPLDDPAKLWRCDGCGAVGTSETLNRG